MLNRKFYIRVDGSSEIGLGHLVRCSSLAHMIKNDFTVHFFCKNIPEGFVEELENSGFNIKLITSEAEFLSALIGKEIVVLDHYGLDSGYQKKIKDIGCKLVCIDDLHDKEFFADLIINHAPLADSEDYEAQSYTRFAVGTNYALLRPEFLKLAKTSEVRKIEKIDRILVCFGGSDYKNFTLKILEYIFEENLEISLIIGTAYLHKDKLQEFIKKKGNNNIKVYSKLSAHEVARELAAADLAIVPASGILIEAMAVGVLIISGYYTENQQDIFNGLLDQNVFYSAGNFGRGEIMEALEKLRRGNHNLLLERQKRSIDGQSAERLLEEMRALC